MRDNTEPSDCELCLGTGIGQTGDPSTSKCGACGGRGYHLSEPEDDGDHAYDVWKDRRLEEGYRPPTRKGQ